MVRVICRAEVDAYIEELIQQHDFRDRSWKKCWRPPSDVRTLLILASARRTRLNWHEYRKIFLDEQRIAGGVEFWQQNQAT